MRIDGGGARSPKTTRRLDAVIDPGAASTMDDDAATDARADSRAHEEEKVGVLLLNLGGPETLDDVQPFLYNLFADPDIIRLPPALRFLQSPLATILSNSRAPKSQEAYASIGGGSPLRRITDEQAAALKAALKSKGVGADVYVGMRYWKPFTEDAVDAIKADGVTTLVVLPLYPQFSISTSGSSLRLLEDIFSEDAQLQRDVAHTVIPSWYDRPGYVASMAKLIKKEIERPDSAFDSPDEPLIFFSAHGVPVSYVEQAGDPYKAEMEDCVARIVDELKRLGVRNEHVLAYQSRVGPVEWLKPYTDDTIRELGEKRGCKAMVAVPISFVSEHIETLEEIDMEYRELAEESGITKWGRVPALDTDPTFIADLADAVVDSLEGMKADVPSARAKKRSGSGVSSGSFDEGWLSSGDYDATDLPPVMPIGAGVDISDLGSVGDLLGVGFKPEPWKWGPLEFAMVTLSILLITILAMDPP